MCNECKLHPTKYGYTECIAWGLSLHVCCFFLSFVCLTFWHTSCSRSGTESTTRGALLLIRQHWNIGIRALTERESELAWFVMLFINIWSLKITYASSLTVIHAEFKWLPEKKNLPQQTLLPLQPLYSNLTSVLIWDTALHSSENNFSGNACIVSAKNIYLTYLCLKI